MGVLWAGRLEAEIPKQELPVGTTPRAFQALSIAFRPHASPLGQRLQQRRKLRLREGRLLAAGHTARSGTRGRAPRQSDVKAPGTPWGRWSGSPQASLLLGRARKFSAGAWRSVVRRWCPWSGKGKHDCLKETASDGFNYT